ADVETEADEHAGHDHEADVETEADEHAGHDHEADVETEADEHAGHDHEAHVETEADEHIGHDHEAHVGTEADEHTGHDHETHVGTEADEHTGHDHETHVETETDGHEGHDHSAHDEHSDLLVINEKQQKNVGLRIERAKKGNISKNIVLTGSIVLNADSLVNHVSRASGIVEKINVSEGDYVRRGDVLAIIDSAELGRTKSRFYEIFNEVGACSIDLRRFEVVARNTKKLLNRLQKRPELDFIQNVEFGDMGEYGSGLLTSYAEFLVSQKSFERKKRLYKEKIVSEKDYLQAQNNYEKAMARYFAQRDNATFEIKQKLLELQRTLRVNEFKLRTVERELQLLGLTHKEISEIRQQGHQIQQSCTEPDCKECATSPDSEAGYLKDKSFSQISIKAGRSGTVTFRDLSLGQEVQKNSILFTVANLTSLWAVLQAPSSDFSFVKPGMKVEISSASGVKTSGRVLLIKPVLDQQTRTFAIRASVDNQDRNWLPGMFINGEIDISAESLPLVIKRSAIQVVDGETVVFAPKENGFEVLPVKTGRRDDSLVEIVSGMRPGQKYVSTGAFALKAIKLTTGLDPHAGHGH
ncbi:MAG: efflux RND transporter periplasmic adaptor subunit, partial [Candidatus Rifleibacteriota bacterium]